MCSKQGVHLPVSIGWLRLVLTAQVHLAEELHEGLTQRNVTMIEFILKSEMQQSANLHATMHYSDSIFDHNCVTGAEKSQ